MFKSGGSFAPADVVVVPVGRVFVLVWYFLVLYMLVVVLVMLLVTKLIIDGQQLP